MKHYNKSGINILIKQMPSTPRMSVAFFFKVNKKEKYFGVNSLLARLLLQGTKTYNANELALAFENECIDVSTKAKQDYIKVSLTFLNEDFKRAMDLAKDILINSTFENYEKEIFKIKGEIISDLDNPKIKLTDLFIKSIFKNHPYSSTLTKVLDDIDNIKKEDILNAHKEMLESFKTIVFVGDYKNQDELLNYFENNFDFMKSYDVKDEVEDIFHNDIKQDETMFISKNDAAQAQIIQGVLIDSFNSDLYSKYMVFNNILGSSGLSSRLFVNLRDKQGLAYTVRSQYETLLHSGIFSLYIGTAPQNIGKSLFGFKDEIEKLANILPSEKELQGAKENISGRIKYFSQNNSQISSIEGYNFLMGLGLNYNEKFMENINNVSLQDVSDMAKNILNLPKVNIIIAPDEFKI